MHRLIASSELKREFCTNFLDISDHRPPTSIGGFDLVNAILAIKHGLQFFLRIISFRPQLVYMGISQGIWGYLRDLEFIIPALLFRRKLVLHLRGSEFRAFYNRMPRLMQWLTRWILSRTARMIVLGYSVNHIFDGLMAQERIAVIPNGIDYSQYNGVKEVGTGFFGRRILYLGSLKKRKGIFILLRALPTVFAKHPEIEVTFAGSWQNTAEKEEADRIINELGLRGKVHFAGEVSGQDKVRLFMNHDLFIFTPVEPEGLPWILLEAMSAALPVITTDQGVIREVVEHKKTGLIIHPDPTHISESILWMLQHPDLAGEMGLRGRDRIKEMFSEKLYLSRLIALFVDVAAVKSRV
jgi:glycosyltransferase involved in cell wall biosynthesis